MNELFNVKDKVVVITGGAGILGKGIAAYLAKEGAKVVVLDRSEEAGKALVESIKAEGNEAMFLYTDVMDKEVLEGNKVEIMKAYGRIDVLLNAAGGLEEREMRAWGGAETLFCARGAQNACFLECCFAPGGRKRRIFRFDEA